MNKKSRINKWRKYREEIDSNENIHFSIVNTDEELKEMFKSIDFDIESAYKKSGYYSKKNNYNVLNKRFEEKKEIEKLLNFIEQNESPKNNNKQTKDFNSHKNDSIINEHFLEFVAREDLEDKIDQGTTDLKINRINIVESKDKQNEKN
ncbi:hypothetical protein ACJA28_01580 [Mesomycoplasma moatsii]|uniref:hypothetical protein n=1 Tax=Mesomycoplasma moatsii TaxID=171287 RepID=UPI0003B6E521